MHTLHTGDLAYFDSFAGMIPCRVLKIASNRGAPHTAIASTAFAITIRLTFRTRFTRYGYKPNAVFIASGINVIPRACYRARSGKIRPYNVEAL